MPRILSPASARRLAVAARSVLQAATALALVSLSTPTPLAQKSGRSDKDVAREVGITVNELRDLRKRQGLTNESIERMTDADLREARFRLLQPERPGEAAKFRELQAGGTQQTAALQKATEQQEAARSLVPASPEPKLTVAGLPIGSHVVYDCPETPPEATEQCPWVELGPKNVGGRIRSVIIAPDGVVWAGSLGGGVWRSPDGSAPFRLVGGLLPNLVITALVIDPRDSKVIYAGTGEGYFDGENINRGAGIFRTTDAGVTWKRITPERNEFLFVNELSISSDGSVLMAATQSGLMCSRRPERDDWEPCLKGVKKADVDFHPTDSAKAVAGTLSDGKAFYTTDGGQKWEQAQHSEQWSGRVEVAYARADPSIVYASVQRNNGEIWRSTDGGKTYVKMAGSQAADDGRALLNDKGAPVPARHLGEVGFHANLIWAGHPRDSNFLILGGLNLWRSTDGGRTLREISKWQEQEAGSLHIDQHCLVPDPGFDGDRNKAVFVCNDGGLAKTDDITTAGSDARRIVGWKPIRGLAITQFHGGDGNPLTGDIVGGTMDNGTQRYTRAGGASAWVEPKVDGIGSGDGGMVVFDREKGPNGEVYVYGESQFLTLFRSTDGGVTAERIYGHFVNAAGNWERKKAPYNIDDADRNGAKFVAPFALDPNDSNRLYAGGKSLWRTNNVREPNKQADALSGPQWKRVKGEVGSFISAVAVTPGRPNVVWVGHDDGRVFVTDDATSDSPRNWRPVDKNGPNRLPDNRVCTRIVVSPSESDTVYVTFGSFTSANVWKTTDSGKNWQQLDASGMLPTAPVYDLAIHPTRPNFLYVGTAVGVLASEDGGATWYPTRQGPTNCAVQDLFWMNETLVAVTHGRGMFKINLATD